MDGDRYNNAYLNKSLYTCRMSQSNLLPLSRPPAQICILRLSAIGDVSHVIPVIRAIQQQWPETGITWVCGLFEYKLLKIIEGVNFVTFDKRRGLLAYRDLWQSLRHKKFDVLMHMQVAARANMASLCIKAEIKLGWDKARSRDLHQLFINHRVEASAKQHQVQGFLSFARALGLPVYEPEWRIPITQNARSFSAKFVSKDQPVLLISASSSHALRNWQAKRYAGLADYAIEKYGMQVILSGGPSPEESMMATEITDAMQNTVINLVGKDTLEQLIGLLACARVVLSPDSGPAHLANAVGVPVIGLYACTASARSGPYNSLDYCLDKFQRAAETVLQKSVDDLRWGRKIEQPGVMDLISLKAVCEMLDRVMSAES